MQFAARMLSLRRQLKLDHWQTHSYAEHKALDGAVSGLDALIDKWVELCAGQFMEMPKLAHALNGMSVQDMGAAGSARKHVAQALEYVQEQRIAMDGKPAMLTLLPVLDDFANALQRVAYLLRLK